MSTTFFPNRNLGYPAIGDSGWGATADTTFGNIDSAFGGNQTFNLATASGTVSVSAIAYNGPYPANTASYIPLSWTLTGVLSDNIILQIPTGVGGQWIVNNQCTMGAYSITVSATDGSSSSILVAGQQIVYSDGLGNINAVISVASSGIAVQNSGADVGTGFTTVNFINATTVTGSGATANVIIPTGGGAAGVAVANNSVVVGTGITSLNIINATSITTSGATANITVSGNSGLNYLPSTETFNATSTGGQFIAPLTETNLNFAAPNPTWGSWNGAVMTIYTTGTYLVSCNVSATVNYKTAIVGSMNVSILHNGIHVSQVTALATQVTLYDFLNQISAIIVCSVGDTISVSMYLLNPGGQFNYGDTGGPTNNMQIVKLI